MSQGKNREKKFPGNPEIAGEFQVLWYSKTNFLVG
jgi:hypothetical protein